MSLTLDVNFELYPLTTGDKFTLLLASSLHGPSPEESGAKGGMDVDEKPKEDRREAWRGGDQGLAADYDYVTYGKVSPSTWSWKSEGWDTLVQDRKERKTLDSGVSGEGEGCIWQLVLD